MRLSLEVLSVSLGALWYSGVPMNILIVALELAPFFQKSPAAESISGLSKALRLLGHEITVLVPRMPAYEEAGLLAARQITPLELEGGGKSVLFDVQLPSGIKLVLAEPEGCAFDPEAVLESQAAPIGAFSRAAAAYVAQQTEQGSAFEVVHCHDAGAGLALLQLGQTGASDLARVLTVHDAERAGTFPVDATDALGVPSDRTGPQGFGSPEGLCLLKGLVSESDAIVTPSDSYSRELQAPEKHGALARAFQGAELVGVVEGVDHAVYNPATDAALSSRYDGPNPANKGRNKSVLLNEFGLELEISRPVLFAECPSDGEPALDTLVRALPAIVRNDVTLIVLAGEGSKAKNAEILTPFEGQVHWLESASPSLRRRILAASDFYLSLQQRDPSGQRLLQASRYGAIPIALRVDATPDVVVDCDAELRTGTGLLFDTMTQRSLSSSTARAVAAYHSSHFPRLLSRVMRQDLAWDRSARRHLLIYKQALAAQA